jgi:hypothetical protein
MSWVARLACRWWQDQNRMELVFIPWDWSLLDIIIIISINIIAVIAIYFGENLLLKYR